jgi:hypothetical protein
MQPRSNQTALDSPGDVTFTLPFTPQEMLHFFERLVLGVPYLMVKLTMTFGKAIFRCRVQNGENTLLSVPPQGSPAYMN